MLGWFQLRFAARLLSNLGAHLSPFHGQIHPRIDLLASSKCGTKPMLCGGPPFPPFSDRTVAPYPQTPARVQR